MSNAPSGYSGTPLPQKLGFKPGLNLTIRKELR
jgi:hypothetical protein